MVHVSAPQHAAKAQDPYFHEVLYNMLVDLRAVPQLLALDSPHLERHLHSLGGLPPDRGPPQPGTAIGPLSPTQVGAASPLPNPPSNISFCASISIGDKYPILHTARG
jgi:hypothetical protein